MSFQLESLPKVGRSVLGYPSRLLSRTEIAKDTLAFQLQRPRNFLFRPGQFIDLALRRVPGDGLLGFTHTLSIASSCFASDILVATRMRDSAFKRALAVLPLGTEVSTAFSTHTPSNTRRPCHSCPADGLDGSARRARPVWTPALLPK